MVGRLCLLPVSVLLTIFAVHSIMAADLRNRAQAAGSPLASMTGGTENMETVNGEVVQGAPSRSKRSYYVPVYKKSSSSFANFPRKIGWGGSGWGSSTGGGGISGLYISLGKGSSGGWGGMNGGGWGGMYGGGWGGMRGGWGGIHGSGWGGTHSGWGGTHSGWGGMRGSGWGSGMSSMGSGWGGSKVIVYPIKKNYFG